MKILGTFDGASIDLQAKTNNSNDSYTTTNDSLFPVTTAGAFNITYSSGVNYKLVLSSAGASTNINAFVTQ